MKQFKRILSIICILATLVLLVQAPTASAYTDLAFNDTYYETIEDEDTSTFTFTVSQKTSITLDLECKPGIKVDIDIEKYDTFYNWYDDYKSFDEKTSFYRTITLKKGKYRISLCRYDWDDDWDDDYCDCCWDCDYWWDGDDCECGCDDCLANKNYNGCDCCSDCSGDEDCDCYCADCLYCEGDEWNGYNCMFTVWATMAKKIKFANKKITMAPGKTKTLTVTGTPYQSLVSGLTWYSSNEKVATVNKNGKVTTKGWGKTIITAETDNGKEAKCTLIVKGNKTLKLHIGSTLNLPKINGKKQKGWKSKNTSIAVGGSTVTGKGDGTTTLYKKIGGVTYTCKVKVINPYTLLSKGKSKLKSDYLYFPSSFIPQTAWRGYYDGDWYYDYDDNSPAVLLKYKAMNLYGQMITEYAIFYYDGGLKYEIYSSKPSKSEFKKRVVL